MFTTLSTSGNTKRCGVSASRSLGPMSGSVLMSSNTRSMTSQNSLGDSNSLLAIARASLYEGGTALHQVLVHRALDRVAHALGELEDQRPVLRGVRPVPGRVDRVADRDPPLGGGRRRAKGPEQGDRRRAREERRPGQLGQQRHLPDLRAALPDAADARRGGRRGRARRQLNEPAAAEALQAVAVLEVL